MRGSTGLRASGRLSTPALLLAIAIAIALPKEAPALAAVDLWTAVARAPAEAAARELRAADEALARSGGGAVGGNRGAESHGAAGASPPVSSSAAAHAAAEHHLREALRWHAGSFEAWQRLADLLATTGRSRAAIAAAETARRFAPTAADEARLWFRLGFEHSRLGAYDRALNAYERQIALAGLESESGINSAELLMAMGRLDEAIERYREAAAIEERAADRRGHSQALALAYYGLAVALDRAERVVASREAINRAVALDPGLATLQLALVGSDDLAFLPAGDVFFYLGLAREALGRIDTARAAYREYLERAGSDRYAARARAHLDSLRPGASAPSPAAPSSSSSSSSSSSPSPSSPSSPDSPATSPSASGGARVRLRVVTHATVEAAGPLVAPLVDAAWRLAPNMLDGCLRAAPPPRAAAGASDGPAADGRLRLSLQLEIDDGGRVREVLARGAGADRLGPAICGCIGDAVKAGLRLPRPSRRKPTRARVELILAPVPAETGGL